MEERKDSVHGIHLQERKRGTLTGVVDVMAFDSEQILLETTLGMMAIKGKELHVSRLQLETGERKRGTLTGVVDVMAFDSEQILLETTLGMMAIKGKELHVSRLQLETGEVDVEGNVDSLVYTEQGVYGKKKKGSLIKRLFQ